MDTPHGRKVWRAFLKTKKGTEDPVNLIISKAKPRNSSSYLEIGGGLGEKTIAIGKKFGFGKIDFIEPSKKASQVFLRNAKKLGIEARLFNTPFERFRPDRKYDLVTSIHSWYYIDLKELDKLYKLLQKGGIACIYLDRKSDIIKRIQDICEKFLGFRSNNIEDLEFFLNKRKIKYDLYCEEKGLKGLIRRGNFTTKAKTIISLVGYTRWDEIPGRTKGKIKDMLTKLSKDDSYTTRRCLILIRK